MTHTALDFATYAELSASDSGCAAQRAAYQVKDGKLARVDRFESRRFVPPVIEFETYAELSSSDAGWAEPQVQYGIQRSELVRPESVQSQPTSRATAERTDVPRHANSTS